MISIDIIMPFLQEWAKLTENVKLEAHSTDCGDEGVIAPSFEQEINNVSRTLDKGTTECKGI